MQINRQMITLMWVAALVAPHFQHASSQVQPLARDLSGTPKVWINKDTRVCVQGMTGSLGSYHTQQAINYGTNVVAGVNGKKANTQHQGVNVYATIAAAREATNCDATAVYLPPPTAANAIIEALEAAVPLIVVFTEGIPVQDMVKVKKALKSHPKSRLIGPNCPGIIKPGECKIGIMPNDIHKPGKIGIVSRSGTGLYEAVDSTTKLGLGQSTVVGIGSDPFNGTNFIDVLQKFMNDPETEGIIMIGEIGGSAEEKACEWIEKNNPQNKPIVGYIAGMRGPLFGRRMGHAGAIISGGKGDANSKIAAMKRAGIIVSESRWNLGAKMMDEIIKKSSA